MTAQLRIDQAGLAAGVTDRARSDGLSTGAQVTLTSVTPGTTNTFSLLWVPLADTGAVSSLANLGVTATFTPTAGVYGTYRVLLIVDESLPTESRTIRTFSIRTPTLGLRKPALNERASADSDLANNGALYIGLSESNEAGSGPFAAGDYGGYFSAITELYDAVETLGTPSTPVGVVTIDETVNMGSDSSPGIEVEVYRYTMPVVEDRTIASIELTAVAVAFAGDSANFKVVATAKVQFGTVSILDVVFLNGPSISDPAWDLFIGANSGDIFINGSSPVESDWRIIGTITLASATYAEA